MEEQRKTGTAIEGSAVRTFVGASILLSCFGYFWAAPVSQIVDTRGITLFSHALIHEGTLSVPVSPDHRKNYRFVPRGDRSRYFFAEMPLVLNAPFVLAFEALDAGPVDAEGNLVRKHETRLLKLVAALLAAITCWLFWRIAVEYLPTVGAALLTVGFAIASPMASTVSRPFWSHGWAVLCATGALYVLMSARFESRRSVHVAMGMLATLAYLCRPPMSLTVVALGVLLLIRRRRQVVWYAAGAALWLGAFVMHSLVTFGTILPRYFRSPGQGFDLDQGFWRSLAGTMISPGRGLVVYLPYLVVLAGLAIAAWRHVPARSVVVAAGAVLATHWVVVASFYNWWGGHSYGPRLFSDLLPWFFVAAVLIVSGGLELAARGGSLSQVALILLALCFAFGTFVHGRGAMDQATLSWHQPIPQTGLPRARRQALFRQERLWNWRYPQFVAGMIEPPALEIPERWKEPRRRKNRPEPSTEID